MHANMTRRRRTLELWSYAAKIVLTLSAVLSLCLPASGQTCNGNPLSYWTAMLGDMSPSRQFQAAFTLGQCGPGAAPALPSLDQALRDQATDLRPRIAIAQAILLIDRNSPAQDIVEFLAGLVQSQREVWAREAAIDALGAAGPRACAAVPLVRSAGNTSIGSTQLKVHRALQNIGPC
jgi:hypothetical protein